MSFLRRIVTFAAAPSVSAGVAPRPPAVTLTLGQLVRPRRRAAPADLPGRHAGFASVTDRELNNGVWPEAGADSASGEDSVPGANPALHQPVSDPWEVAGNGERRDVPSKHRSWQKLEVSRLLGERIQSGKSVESAQRPVFDTSAKAVSEWTSVHTNPPSHRPAKHSPAPAAAPAPSTSRLVPAPAVFSPDSSPVPRQALSDAAFSGANEPGTPSEAVPPGAFVDRAGGATEAVQTANGFQGAVSLPPFTPAPSPPTMHAAADTGSIAGITMPPLPAAVSEMVSPDMAAPDGRAGPSRPAAAVVPAVSSGRVEFASWPNAPRRDAPAAAGAPEPAPAVHIGTVEIFIEAAAAPRNTSHPASRQGDFASRHYLRGL